MRHKTQAPFSIERREPGPHDDSIKILFCGVCHTDIHFVRDDLGMALYTMVPGRELVYELMGLWVYGSMGL
ncbi:alcohol dehydrogenase catalytic domain-containing protein [Lunatibacter salilacus]|uniref:alcohol dehydrogenase catalytic domain-containing protein n=1 Tax=Lunatibacter salilacus TaxID=2483804 RepID=UPI0018FE904E|nr:alcohol dehydrogenase catalytic domain-containing protein [Lunatibacter salilacus]